MNYILSVYSANAFKENLLPSIDDADYSITLQSSLFGITEDVDIELEVIDGKWKVVPAMNYIHAAPQEDF